MTIYYETIFQERGGAGSQFTFEGGDISVDTINNRYGTFRDIWDNSAYVQNLTYIDNEKQFIDALNNRSVGNIYVNRLLTFTSGFTTQCKSDKQIYGEPIALNNGITWTVTHGNELYIHNDILIEDGTTATIVKGAGLWAKSVYGSSDFLTVNDDLRNTGKLRVNGSSFVYERLLRGANNSRRQYSYC